MFRALNRVGLALVLALPALTGCAYLRHRGNDAAEMVDIGVTWTKTPYFSIHACGMGIVSAGAGKVNGHFAGLGGNQFGVTRHYHKDLGLVLWSYDELGWGDDFDPEKPETLDAFHVGPIGWIGYPDRRPPYALACVHYLHLGYGGLVANIRYMEMVDFLLGWTTFDICGDDGEQRGDWPWRKSNPRTKEVYRPKLPY